MTVDRPGGDIGFPAGTAHHELAPFGPDKQVLQGKVPAGALCHLTSAFVVQHEAGTVCHKREPHILGVVQIGGLQPPVRFGEEASNSKLVGTVWRDEPGSTSVATP